VAIAAAAIATWQQSDPVNS